MSKTKLAIKVKGSPRQVLKALHTITNSEPPAPTMRPADVKAYQKRFN